jgi:DNA polymerase elongation subunit (family B)
MTEHIIQTKQDFLDLKAFVTECGYKTVLSPDELKKDISDFNNLESVKVQFDSGEAFFVDARVSHSKDVLAWLKTLLSDNNEDLIYGKNKLERVVAIEAGDNFTEIFTEDKDGSLKIETINNEYWLLSAFKHDTSWFKLDGALFYNYMKKYSTRDEWLEERKKYKRYQPFSIWSDNEAAMVLQGFSYYKGMKPEDVSILAFDIEATTLEHTSQSKTLLISNTFRKCGKIVKKLFAYDEFKDEGEMLNAWCNWVREVNPSLIAGHNVFGYDLPYLHFCAKRNGVELNLGRDGSAIKFNEYDSQYRKDGSQSYSYRKAFIYGREIVDTMFLAIKYDAAARKYESYGLKNIIKEEGLEKTNRTFYDSSLIRKNYKDPVEWEKIKLYCIDDSDDALSLYDLMIPAYFYLANSIPKPFQDIICSATGSWINYLMLRSYLQHGHSIPRESAAENYEGAISFGSPGLYHNIFKVDVSSLYPSIILQYEVYDKIKDPKRHFLNLIEHFTKERLKNKKIANEEKSKYHKDLSEAQKIVINSGYGFMGASGLNFNSPQNASFITRKGREILQTSVDWAVENMFTVVNGDTDSISISYNNEELSEDDRKNILECINSLFPEKIRFADDGYFKHGCILKAKNYALEDYNGKIKIKGSALKASSKEKALKKFVNDVIVLLLHSESEKVLSLYNNIVKEIFTLTKIDDWTSKKTVTAKVLAGERTTEEKILTAISGTEYKEGDKVWVYFKEDQSLGLRETWKRDHDKITLVKKLFKTIEIFDAVLNVEQFPNYSLKKNKKLLDDLLKV